METLQHNVTSKTMLVTPEMAEKWLTKNTINRPVSEMNIESLLSKMKKNQWVITTDSIGFDIDGKLNNGQHRLLALIRYGKELPFLVSRGLPLASFNCIDTGKIRTSGDVLGASGVASSKPKSSIITFLLASSKGKSVDRSSKSLKISNQDVLDFYNKHSHKIDQAHKASILYTKKFKAIEARYIGGLYYTFSKIDQDFADRFFLSYSNGLGLTLGNPVFALRERLMADWKSVKKYSTNDKISWVIIAWNAFHSGRKLQSIRNRTSEEMPIPQ